MKAALRYCLLICIGLLFGRAYAHASISINLQLPEAKQSIQTINNGSAAATFFDRSQDSAKDDESLVSEEDDDEDCATKKLFTYFKSLVLFAQALLIDHSSHNNSIGLHPEDHPCFAATPKYIQQRVLKI